MLSQTITMYTKSIHFDSTEMSSPYYITAKTSDCVITWTTLDPDGAILQYIHIQTYSGFWILTCIDDATLL